jgi:hypothetical protein
MISSSSPIIANFRTREINQDTHKLTRTPTLIEKKKSTNNKEIQAYGSWNDQTNPGLVAFKKILVSFV